MQRTGTLAANGQAPKVRPNCSGRRTALRQRRLDPHAVDFVVVDAASLAGPHRRALQRRPPTVTYTVAFSVKAMGVTASAAEPLAAIVRHALLELAGQIIDTANELADDVETRQEMPKMAELGIDYDRTPFWAIRLVGESARNRAGHRRREVTVA